MKSAARGLLLRHDRFNEPQSRCSLRVDCVEKLKVSRSSENLANVALWRFLPLRGAVELIRGPAIRSGRSSNGRSTAFRRKLSCLPQRFDQTAFVGNALARDIEGRTMIDRSTDHRQTDGDVHAGLQSQHLDRAMTLIMIHCNYHVVVAAAGKKKQRVGRQRASHIPASALTGIDGGRDFRRFLTSAE